jgi:hypothetical protein
MVNKIAICPPIAENLLHHPGELHGVVAALLWSVQLTTFFTIEASSMGSDPQHLSLFI